MQECHEERRHRAARPALDRVVDAALVVRERLDAGERQASLRHGAVSSPSAASRSAIGGTKRRSVSQGKKIHVSWLTSVTKVCASERPGRLGVDAGEVRARQHLADDAGGGAGIGEIVDDQDVLTVARDRFQNSRRPLVLMVVGRDADGIDHADVELAGDDRRRHHAAASDRDDAAPGAALGQPPGKRAGVAMKLIP